MKKTIGSLRQLFRTLYQIQEKRWFRQARTINKDALTAYNMLAYKWYPLSDRETDELFADPETVHIDFAELRRVLYLPPLERDARFVPVLSLTCNLDETTTEISSQVMLVSLLEDEEQQSRLCGVGFRLESGAGRHDFYHAQLIRDLPGGPPIACPTWLPDTQPSFPLLANCPVTLILSLLLSLYGIEWCRAFVADHDIFQLKSYLRDLDSWMKSSSD